MSLFFVLMDRQNTSNEKRTLYARAADYVYSVFSAVILIMLCFFVLFTFFFRLASVDGSSMNPNLYDKQKIIVSNFLYTPEYGDIIAIGRASEEENSIIKRVIGLPGDEIDINFDTHIITVNAGVITEDYETIGAISEKGDTDFPVTVPENCVFVLGDNRNNSIDSRFSSVGFIDLDEIAGKALFSLFPPGSIY